MSTLIEVFSQFQATPNLCNDLMLQTMLDFIQLSRALKNAVIHLQSAKWDPEDIPALLPDRVCAFLAQKLDISMDYVDGLWDGLKDFAWNCLEEGPAASTDWRLFDDADMRHELCAYFLYSIIYSF